MGLIFIFLRISLFGDTYNTGKWKKIKLGCHLGAILLGIESAPLSEDEDDD